MGGRIQISFVIFGFITIVIDDKWIFSYQGRVSLKHFIGKFTIYPVIRLAKSTSQMVLHIIKSLPRESSTRRVRLDIPVNGCAFNAYR
jgi:hypothetical protein